MKSLIVVVGPTAVGKTSLCIDLAKAFDTEIISADSRQFYREMEIGTAKPTAEELSQAKHHFVDSHSIEENFSAGDFEKEGLAKIYDLFETHDVLIMTGGSGLYLNAITEGMADMPEVDMQVRDQLNDRLAAEGLEALVTELEDLDPKYYKEVDLNNPQRVIRALEVCMSSGQKYSELRKKSVKQRDFEVIKIGLDRPREELYKRIDERMDIMITEGLFEEAKKLYPYKDHNALQTVGYKEIFGYMDGEYDREEAVRLLKRNSRRYAKRQMTWFRRDEDIKWFHPGDVQAVIAFVKTQTNHG